jgi:hypothetical protein
MKNRGLAFILTSLLTSQLIASEPPRHIDLGAMPATVVDDVIIPVPSEIFGVLDKLGTPNWHEVLRTTQSNAIGERPQVALLLGTVIAEGFIAVEAEESEEVKKIGRNVLNLASAVGVRKSVAARSKAIIDAADRKDWQRVRLELDGALTDVKTAMIELHDEQLAQLVSLGGWLRGTEALTSVVNRSYSKDGAELLRQPALLEYFQRRLKEMDPRLRKDELVAKVAQSLSQMKPVIDETGDVSPKDVEKIHDITAALVRKVNTR